jgi:integrase
LPHRDLRAEQITGLLAAWKQRYARNTWYKRVKLTRQILRALEADGAPKVTIGPTVGPRARTRIAVADELPKMLQAAPPGMKLFLLLTSALGLRFAEAASLKPDNWNAEKHTITYTKKGGDTHTLPVTPEIEELFTVAARENTAFLDVLIPRQHGDLTRRIRAEWVQLREKAGVKADLKPHDLRRTAAVSLYELTKDIRAVQQLLGHQSLSTTAWYLQHADTEKIRPLVEQMWRHTGKAIQ